MAHTYTDIGTHKYMYIQTHTDSDADTISHLHFWLNWHTCQRYKFYIWCTTDIHRQLHTDTHTNVQAHIDTGTHRCMHTHRDAHKHTLRHTQTHVCLYINTHTHTYVHIGNVRKLLLQSHF